MDDLAFDDFYSNVQLVTNRRRGKELYLNSFGILRNRTGSDALSAPDDLPDALRDIGEIGLRLGRPFNADDKVWNNMRRDLPIRLDQCGEECK